MSGSATAGSLMTSPEVYALPGYDFVPPAGWVDRSIHTFVLDDGNSTASLTVTRALVPAGVTPAAFVEGEIERLSHSLPDFAVSDRRAMAIEQGTTELVECRWRTEHGTVDQLIACLPIEGGLLVFTGAAPAPMPGSIRNRLLGAIASAQTREPGGPGRAA